MTGNSVALPQTLLFAFVLVSAPQAVGQESAKESSCHPIGNYRFVRESVEKAKGVVKQMLKDPSTVQFQNVFVSRKAGMPIVCGRVNAKISFGAYSGYQRFVSGAEQRLTFLENEVEGFIPMWQQLC